MKEGSVLVALLLLSVFSYSFVSAQATISDSLFNLTNDSSRFWVRDSSRAGDGGVFDEHSYWNSFSLLNSHKKNIDSSNGDDDYGQIINYLNLTATSDDGEGVYGIYNIIRYSSNFSLTDAIYTYYDAVWNQGGGTISNIRGTTSASSTTSNSTTTTQVGMSIYGTASTGGNIVNLTGLEVLSRVYADSVINRSTGILINAASNLGGTIGEAYGIEISDLNATSNNFAIYQRGSDDTNYFAGNVGINTTAPTHALTIIGDVNVTGAFTSSGGQWSEKFGINATTSDFEESTAIGYFANTSSHRALAIGSRTIAAHRSVALGTDAQATGAQAIAIGKETIANASNSIGIGYNVLADEANSMVVGKADNSDYIDDVYIGSGRVHSNPISVTIHASGGLGTNISGANLTLAGGMGTGVGTGGNIIFQTANASNVSSDSPNTLETRMVITQGGKIGIGTTTPSSIISIELNESSTPAIHVLFPEPAQNGHSIIRLETNESGGDPKFQVRNNGSTWSMGIDRSNENGNFLISNASALGGTQAKLSISPSGNVGIGIGSSTATHELNVVGDANITGTIYGDGSGLTNLPSSSGAWNSSSGIVFLANTSATVGIGTPSPNTAGRNALDINGTVEVHNTNAAVGVSLFTHSDTSWRDPELLFYKSRGSQESPTAISSGDLLGFIKLGGYDGTDYEWSASIHAATSQNWDNVSRGSELRFDTTPNNGTSSVRRMTIKESGAIGINVSTPSHALNVFGDFNATGTSYLSGIIISSQNISLDVINAKSANISFSNSSGSLIAKFSDDGSLGLGLGTRSPESLLDIAGHITLRTPGGRLKMNDSNGSLNLLGAAGKSLGAYIQIAGDSAPNPGRIENIIKGTGEFRIVSTPFASSNQTELLRVNASGYMGIGTTDPTTKLQVNGSIRTAPMSTATCDTSREGAIYYDSDDNNFYGCNATDWVQLNN